MSGPSVDVWQCPQCGYGFVAANYAAAFRDGAMEMREAIAKIADRDWGECGEGVSPRTIREVPLPEPPK